MKSSELLLSSAERFAAVTATSANISGEQTLRQSRLNIGMQCSPCTSYGGYKNYGTHPLI